MFNVILLNAKQQLRLITLGKCKFKTFVANFYRISYKSSFFHKKSQQNAIKNNKATTFTAVAL